MVAEAESGAGVRNGHEFGAGHKLWGWGGNEIRVSIYVPTIFGGRRKLICINGFPCGTIVSRRFSVRISTQK